MFDQRYESRLVYSGQLAGEQIFNHDRTKINWMLGYGITNRNQPDNRRLTYVEITDRESDKFNQRYLRIQNIPNPYLAGRLWIDMNEKIADTKIDLVHNFSPFDLELPWQLKSGFFHEQKNRSLASRLLGVVATRNPKIDFFQSAETVFNPANFYFDRTAPYTENGLSYRDNTRAKDSYQAVDKLSAFYMALNIPFSKKINVYGGLRAENWNRKISGFSEIVAGQTENAITRDTLDLFPSVNISYNVNEKNLIRASYGKTVNRAEFREMAPFDYQDFELFAIVYGNPDLKSSYVSNYDLRYELYPRQGEMISLAAFYKSFKNPIETFLRPSGSTYDYIPFNTENAYSSGIEIDVRKRLEEFENSGSFLRFLKDMTVVFNTSLIKSKINTSKQEFTRDTVRVMSGQSPYIVNLSLLYSNPDAKWDISLTYNTIGKRLAYVGTPTKPHTWELSRNSLDLTIQKGLGEKFLLKAGLKDILNDPVQYVQYYGTDESIKAYTRKYIPNRQFSLSVIWSL
jgi:outer membrane receptor protein involved in Fe transport